MSAGQLLLVRRQLTLADGVTTVDTGITQVSLATDPPVGGVEASEGVAGTASRVQVLPLAPLQAWTTGQIEHGEPRLNASGTIEVDFWVAAGTGPQTINVLFWDPHTSITPMTSEVANPFVCAPLTQWDFKSWTDTAVPAALDNPAAGEDDQAVFAFVAVNLQDNFNSATSDPVASDAGWTLLRRASVTTGGNTGLKFAVFTRLSTAADPATYGFTWTATIFSGVAIGVSYVPVNTTDWVQADAAVTVASTPTNPLSIAAPSLDATVSLPVLLVVHVANTDVDVWSTPAGMTAVTNTVNNTQPLSISLAQEDILTAGPTGTRSATLPGFAAVGFAYAITVNPFCSIFPS